MQSSSRCGPLGLREPIRIFSRRTALTLALGCALGITLSGGCPTDSSTTESPGAELGGNSTVGGEVASVNQSDGNGSVSGSANANTNSDSGDDALPAGSVTARNA